jgi:DNA sulfur modification protein DndC
MEAMVDSGCEWLEPMLEFRDWLAATQDPVRKKETRDHRRRNGRVEYFTDSTGQRKLRWGPYTLDFRRVILRKLLEAQVQVHSKGGDRNLELITIDELVRIRQLWRLTEGDWEDNLPTIYREVIGRQLDIPADDWSGMGAAEKAVLHEVALKHALAPEMLTKLFDAEREQHGMNRRSRIYSRIDEVLATDWQDRDSAIAGIGTLDVAEESNGSELI